MKKAWIALVALAVLALPATAMAHHGPKPDVKNAAKYCKSLRTEMGADAFRQAYGGGSNAFGKCVSQRVHDLRDARKAARTACAQHKPNLRAFRRCVELKSRHATAGDKADFIAAVRTCLTEHDADPATFQDTYGDGDSSDADAFKSCVEQHLQGDDQGDDQGDGTEPGDGSGDQAQPGDDTPDSPSDT
jgi:hypothetical protein